MGPRTLAIGSLFMLTLLKAMGQGDCFGPNGYVEMESPDPYDLYGTASFTVEGNSRSDSCSLNITASAGQRYIIFGLSRKLFYVPLQLRKFLREHDDVRPDWPCRHFGHRYDCRQWDVAAPAEHATGPTVGSGRHSNVPRL